MQSEENLILLNLLLQITFLSSIAIVLAYKFKQNAAARYGILFPAMISLVLLTLTSLFLQSRDTALIYLPIDLENSSTTSLEEAIAYNKNLLAGFDLEFLDSELVGETFDELSGVGSSLPGTFWEQFLSLPIFIVLMGIWIGGMLIMTMGLLRSFHNIDKLSSNSRRLTGKELRRIAKQLGSFEPAAQAVRFRVSNQIASPMLIGLINATIFFPTGFVAKLNEQQLRSVLLHELAHFERKDLLANFLQKTILTIFWFHPLVHIIDKMITRAREEICDNYVLATEAPLEYGEALLRVSAVTADCKNGNPSVALAVGILGGEWKLEQRIGELLDKNRERTMKLSRRRNQLLQALLLSLTAFLSACQVGMADSNNSQDVPTDTQSSSSTAPTLSRPTIQTPAQPESAPSSISRVTLGPEVKRAITQIQEYLKPTDQQVESDPEAAKQLLDNLYNNRYENMNDFEKQTVFNFYTNYYLGEEDYQQAIRSFEQILNLENIPEDTRLRTLRSLGQLHAAEENWLNSIAFYNQWRDYSGTEDDIVFRGLSYANYQLEQWEEAEEHWLAYLAIQRDNEVELVRDDYSYLIGIHFIQENFDSALDLCKEMILLFNDPKDWKNLRAIYNELDAEREAAEAGALGVASQRNIAETQVTEEIVTPVEGEDYLPQVVVRPEYPTRAAQRGITGWTLVEFTVDGFGGVVPNSIQVIDAEPPNIFNRASIRAAMKFKFQPRLVDGEPIVVPGVQYLFNYKLEV